MLFLSQPFQNYQQLMACLMFCIDHDHIKCCAKVFSLHCYSGGNRSVLKIFDQLICSSLTVPLISSSHNSPNFKKFNKMFKTSCLLTIMTNQNDH